MGDVSRGRILVLLLAVCFTGLTAGRAHCEDLAQVQVPAPAIAAGYNRRTFGPSVTLGANWYKFNFYGTDPTTIQIQEKPEGIIIGGGGNTYNAQLSTAHRDGSGWQGAAFGGGGYFEATLSWRGPYKGYGSGGNGWPAWWSNDLERMSGTYDGPNSTEKVLSSKSSIEVDFTEFWSDRVWGAGLHSWFGRFGNMHLDIGKRTFLPASVTASDPHRYGFLWIPATPQSAGRAEFYFDRIHIFAMDVSWGPDDSTGQVPPVIGPDIFSILDARHLVLLLGTGSDNPMTVYQVEVWQNSSNTNLAVP